MHNEELNDLYCSPNIVRVIKTKIESWVSHVACMGVGRVVYRIWWENFRERGQRGNPGVDVMIIVKWIFRKWDVGV